MKAIIFFLIAFSALFIDVSGNDITAKVVSVIDGNTIEVESVENGIQRIVFLGIDCPELEQEYGLEAKEFTTRLMLQKNVRIQFKGKDRFGNYVAIVMVEDEDIRVELLKKGFAWTEEKKSVPDLEGYRSWAQQKGKGLWRDPNPTPPWVFRRQHSMLQPKSS